MCIRASFFSHFLKFKKCHLKNDKKNDNVVQPVIKKCVHF